MHWKVPSKRNRWMYPALALLVAVFARPAGAIQADAESPGVVDVVKPDAPKPVVIPGVVPSAGPSDPKARKTYATAIDWEKHRDYASALDCFRKANKQDGGRCVECMLRAYNLAEGLGDYKQAAEVARDMVPVAQSDFDKGLAHFRLALALQQQGLKEKKDQSLQESADEFKSVLQTEPKLTRAHFDWGITLAHLHQDDAARTQFTAFLDEDSSNPTLHDRAERFVNRVELARSVMAPPFTVTTIDGQQISMDSLAGKVVLIDFWATWCGPCRQALPNVQYIARKFEGQPFVLISISLDHDEAAWRTFVEKNKMTWTQVRDGGFNGPVASKFGVKAIPATFSIDADGVVQDERVGDSDIEGKLKKMIARAVEKRNAEPAPPAVPDASGSGN